MIEDKAMAHYMLQANTLIEALPYIQQFSGKTIVIKYGGSFMYDTNIQKKVMDDIALMKLVGLKPILVHGGGKDISSMLNQLEIETKFVDGLRVTDENVVSVAEMVLAGKINKEIVQLLQDREIKAVGITGKDGGMLTVKKKYAHGIDLGFVGQIVQVDTDLLETLMERDYTPVIAPIGADRKGRSFNINADHAACAVAKALKAEKLIYLTDTDGVYMDADNPDSRIFRMTIERAWQLIEQGVISGGMIPKVENAIDAIEHEVNSVHIIDGKVEHSLLLEMFTDAGCGTMIREFLPVAKQTTGEQNA